MKKIIAGLFSLIAINSYSQLTVTPGFTATDLANTLAGTSVTITGATITGTTAMRGKFNYVGTDFPISSGVILSNGDVSEAIGPNTGNTSTSMGQPGHPMLDAIAGVATYDAVEFTFDFEVQSSEISFNYVFASEEYNEFVGSAFNDVFAFFISGPGIVGWENIALITGTDVPVAINNVNLGSYWQYYNDNDTGAVNIQFDGFTDMFTASKDSLIPCSVYTLKLIIADAGDDALNSAVFLEENSLNQGTVSASAATFSANDIALEGCIDASFTFTLDSALTTNTNIPIAIGGTAVNGVDYSFIDTLVIIPAGQLSATIIVNALSDGLLEGQESIELYFTPAPCQPQDTVNLYIDDYTTLQYETIVTNVSCYGAENGELDFTITGGTAPFTVTLTDSASGVSTTYPTYPITGLDAGTYFIDVIDDYGCPAEDIIVGNLYTGGPVFLPDGDGGVYTTTLPISGMPAPGILTSLSMLESICITMEHSRIGELDIKLQAPDGTTIELKQQPGGNVTNFGEPCATGPTDGGGGSGTAPGIGYTYCFTPTPTYGTMVAESGIYTYSYTNICTGLVESDKYLPAGSYTSFDPLSDLIGVPINGSWTIIVEDHIPNNNGWIFDWSISFAADPPDSIAYITEPEEPSVSFTTVDPTCGLNNGSINVTTTGVNSPFTFSWSSGPTTEDISGVGAGTYTLTVTDALGCTHPFTIPLSNTGGTTVTLNTTNQQCVGTNTGSIDLVLGVGAGPFTYAWSNGATTQDISGLAPGTYSVTVTNGAGCITSATTTVNAATDIIITGAVTNESCGDQEGAIDINVIGGNPVTYSYIWSNTATTQDIYDLTQGTYSVVVTDGNGCTQVDTFTVANIVGGCVPVCDLNVINTIFGDETCGNGNGIIGINVSTTNAPYTILWSNGATTSTISGLSAGTYSVTVQDNEGCIFTASYTVNNLTGSLAITSTNIVNEVCGNGDGSIDITVSGGVMPYSYSWSSGPTTQDLTSLSGGVYTVDITDANGCTLSQAITVLNQTGTMAQTYGNAEDEICGASNGTIDITIVGGDAPISYLWSSGATTQDLIGIPAGTYTCTVTDNSGCSLTTPTYTVNNLSGGLAIININADDEICGNAQGEILLTMGGGVTPYTYLWNTGATTEDISGLTDGTYSCTITDANGCSVNTGPIVVNDLPGSLNLNSVSVVNEVCGSGTGIVNISVSGGTAPISFLWNTGSTSEDLYSLSTGSYTCTISDAAGCVTTASGYVMNESGTLTIDNMVVTNESCGDASGMVNLFISGETGAVTYAWSNSATTQDINSLSAGNYTVTVTDASGCSISGTATVGNTTSSGFGVNLVSASNEICGNSNGAINISTTGGISPITFAWSNSATTEDISLLTAGTYSVIATDSAGCSVSLSTTINNTSGTLASTGSITNELCSNGAGAINLTPTGGTAPYTFLWSTAATTEDVSSLSSGTYSVTVTDASGCQNTSNYTVTNSSGTMSISSATIGDDVCGGTTGAIDITVTGGSGSYTYSWSSGPTTQDISGLSAGTYNVTVSDGSGCVISGASYTVNSSSGTFVLVSLNETDEVCGNSTGAVSASYAGGVGPITFLWNTGATTQNISGLGAGVYSCTATDANGCVINITGVVNNDPGTLAVGSAVIMNETCATSNGSVNISVSGGSGTYSYVWSNGATTQDINSLSAGTYMLTVNDGGGCFQNVSYNVSNSGGNPVISGFSVTDEMCGMNNGSATVNVSGGTGPYTYSWAAPSCCEYSLLMTGVGTWSSAKVEVQVNGTFFGLFNCIGTSTTVPIPVCTGDTIDLIYTPGGFSNKYYYLYDATGTLLFSDGPAPTGGPSYTGIADCSSSASGATYSGISAGSYTVTVTDANGCSVSGTTTVGTSTSGLDVSSSVVTNFGCGVMGAIDITVTGGGTSPISYLWSNGATTEDISSLLAGAYSVTVSNTDGCSTTENYTVINTTGLVVSDTVIVSDICNGGLGGINVTVNGGILPYSFSWSTSDVTEDVLGLIAGTYSFTFTDSTGCSITESYIIPNSITGTNISATLITDEFCGDDAGAIDITVSGGPVPYEYLWSTTDTTEDLTGLVAGTYDVTITDSMGCIITQSITVNNVTNGLASTAVIDIETCLGNDGAINLTTTGGFPPYTFNWSTGDTTEDLSGLVAGTYTCIILDSTLCEMTLVLTVPYAPQDIVITSAVINDDFCDNGNGDINISVSGSATPFTYLWSEGTTTQDLVNEPQGYYWVTITDANGCTLTDTFYLPNTAFFAISDSVIGNATCDTCANGSIGLTLTGAFAPTFSWSNGATTEDIEGLLPGTYTVTITDFGCTITQTFVIDSSATIGLQEINTQSINLYPNPTSRMVTIDYRLNNKSNVMLYVESMLGQVVFSKSIKETSQDKFTIDLSNLERGTYFITLSSGIQSISAKLILIR